MAAFPATGTGIGRARFARTQFARAVQTTATTRGQSLGVLASGGTAAFSLGLGSCHARLQRATARVAALTSTRAGVWCARVAATNLADTDGIAAAASFGRGIAFNLSTRHCSGEQQRNSQQTSKRGEKLRHDSFPLKSNLTGIQNRATQRDHSPSARRSGTGLNSRAYSHRRET